MSFFSWSDVSGFDDCVGLKRCGHTATRLAPPNSETIVVALGDNHKLKNAPRKFFDDVVALNMGEPRSWQQATVPHDVLPGRSHHAACGLSDGVFFVGGRGSGADPYFEKGKCCAFWRLRDDSGNTVNKWQKIKCPSNVARRGHSLTHYPDANKCVVFGGERGGKVFNDVWLFDSYVLQWQSISTQGQLPPGKLFHCATGAFNGNAFVVAGGQCAEHTFDVHLLDLRSSSWLKLAGEDKNCSNPLFGQSIHPLASDYQFLMVGGAGIEYLRTGRVNSDNILLQILDLRKGTAEFPESYSIVSSHSGDSCPTGRLFHTSTILDQGLVVVGGWQPNDNETAEDVSILAPSSKGSLSLDLEVVGESSTRVALERNNSDRDLPEMEIPGVRLRSRAVVASPKGGLRGKEYGSMTHSSDAMKKIGRVQTVLRTESFRSQPTGTQGPLKCAERVIERTLLSEFRPEERFALLSIEEFLSLCAATSSILLDGPTVVPCRAPAKIFGDIHGQFDVLLDFFRTFGSPNHRRGDINLVQYVFLGDFCDRGKQSLEVLSLLFSLKVRYQKRVVLVRGNHEDREINQRYGLLTECQSRIPGDEKTAMRVWEAINSVFDSLPLAALIEDKIFCVHGGIGRSVRSVEQINSIERPLPLSRLPDGLIHVVLDMLWSDPTETDRVLGIHANRRGQYATKFGPDRVESFCEENALQLIVRAHECVAAGYEYFAGGRLITVFSAAKYAGRHNNAGAFLEVSRDLEVQPKILAI